MTRPYIKAGNSVPPPASTPFPLRPATPAYAPPQFGSWWDHFLVRMIFAVACVAAGYHFHPFELSKWVDAGIGLAFSISVFLFEIRLQRASMRRLIGAAVGSILSSVYRDHLGGATTGLSEAKAATGRPSASGCRSSTWDRECGQPSASWPRCSSAPGPDGAARVRPRCTRRRLPG